MDQKDIQEIVIEGTLDNVIETLIRYESRGMRVCTEFKGVMLYSDDITIEGAYQKVYGMTQKQFHEQENKKRMEEVEKAKRAKRPQVPYYQVAKQALMKWDGLTEEKAKAVIASQTFAQIDSQVYAKGSMDYAIEGICKTLHLSDSQKSKLTEFVYDGNNQEFITELLGNTAESAGISQNSLVMSTLFRVHDGWVKDNAKKFNVRDKKYQHMPSELIGWEEVKSDLIFVRPIFEDAGVEIDEDALHKEYNRRVKEFYLGNDIYSTIDLVKLIAQGKDFYQALEGYGDILKQIGDTTYVSENIIPGIEEKGIGPIGKVEKDIIIPQVIEDPKKDDISRLSTIEQSRVQNAIQNENNELRNQLKELYRQNKMITSILALSEERKQLKAKIKEQEEIRAKNIKALGDR